MLLELFKYYFYGCIIIGIVVGFILSFNSKGNYIPIILYSISLLLGSPYLLFSCKITVKDIEDLFQTKNEQIKIIVKD